MVQLVVQNFTFLPCYGQYGQLKMSTGILHCNRLENNQDDNVKKLQNVLSTSKWRNDVKIPTINLCKEIVFLCSRFSG